jgi:hypothetical protein
MTFGLCLLALLSAHAFAAGRPAKLPACGPAPAGAARLASYVGVQVPGTYSVDVTWQDGEWRPADNLPMPHHHATRLELTNAAAFTSLDGHRAERVRLTVEITARDVRKVSGRGQWRTTYHARILDACVRTAAP